ncbi:EVE domain-containing protein [Candidatus Puniceispirillum sp.]|jgi:predicted RNA-binding protein with PUA-like domain|uniref:EVE domain-containing protein n=1 Tax=Candidatus Puniceispirillum sp. TaxID=2026719 RepID=UPI001EBA83F5|nr:EVE domain-containing protein [Candidatus Puniceispirillum sp.]MBT6566010.1 EVE domain-containing protein [Candidatus Puniceispirillum sp.]
MHYWLLKSEPSSWSWQNQLDRGETGEGWDGVRNHQASNNMKAMQIGDLAFFYHSVNEKQIVGIVEICALYHPDPTDASGRFGMVSVKAVKSVTKPVTLASIKADERLQDMALVRQARLSVMPVTESQWHIIMDMAETTL